MPDILEAWYSIADSQIGSCKRPPIIRSGITLCMHLANERQCYIVMACLIGWVHTQNDPCKTTLRGGSTLRENNEDM